MDSIRYEGGNDVGIHVPKPVFEGLDAIRQSGTTNMLDYHAVLRLAAMLNHQDTVQWLMQHKEEYWQGVLYGIEPDD